jgi:CheY-like chemotaxis protein
MACILVIDDAAEMRTVVRRMLERAEHLVIEADDGNVGLAMFQEHRPALVITDLIMPNMEGIETIQRIRRSCQNTKIIAMSGIIEARATMYLDAARKLGADAAIAKPFSRAALLEIVDRLLNGSAEPKARAVALEDCKHFTRLLPAP